MRLAYAWIAPHHFPSSSAAILRIPARRPIKPVYIRAFVDYIDSVEIAERDG
jgi:hypothetical protein